MKKLCLLLALTFAPAAGAAYRCVDDKGRTHIGDTPPLGCANVMMYEVSRGGKVLREIPPTMTEEQIRAKAEEDARRKAEAKIAAEQKRKDVALLATYSSEKEFDVVRDRTIEPITGRIRSAQDRLKEIDKRTKKVKEELEFYTAGKSKSSSRKDAPPTMLTSELERLEAEKVNIDRNIANYEKEIEELRAKFEVDKQRWVEIKLRGSGASPPAVVPTAAPGAKK